MKTIHLTFFISKSLDLEVALSLGHSNEHNCLRIQRSHPQNVIRLLMVSKYFNPSGLSEHIFSLQEHESSCKGKDFSLGKLDNPFFKITRRTLCNNKKKTLEIKDYRGISSTSDVGLSDYDIYELAFCPSEL